MTQHLKPEKKRDANSQQQASIVNDDKAPKFLFADSLSPIEIMVSFASLSRWYETKSELPEKQSKPKATKEKSESFLSDHDLLSLNESKFSFRTSSSTSLGSHLFDSVMV